MYVKKDDGIYQIINTGNCVIEAFVGTETGVVITTDKAVINALGTEFATITFQWSRFNMETGIYDPVSMRDPILVDIAGTQAFLTPDETGKCVIEFDAEQPGEYDISIAMDGYDCGRAKVVAR